MYFYNEIWSKLSPVTTNTSLSSIIVVPLGSIVLPPRFIITIKTSSDISASAILLFTHLLSDVILTSVVKNLEGGVYDVVKEMVDGKFTPGTTELGLKEDGVYLADNNGKVSQEVLDKVNEFKEKIISGEIVVPKTIEELKNFNS